MRTKFRITQKWVKDQWQAYDGIVELFEVLNIDHGGVDFVFEIKLKEKSLAVFCDARTMTKTEGKNQIVRQKFKGWCSLEKDRLSQEKVEVTFGDYPNGNAILTIRNEDGTLYYSDTSPYYMQIIEQVGT